MHYTFWTAMEQNANLLLLLGMAGGGLVYGLIMVRFAGWRGHDIFNGCFSALICAFLFAVLRNASNANQTLIWLSVAAIIAEAAFYVGAAINLRFARKRTEDELHKATTTFNDAAAQARDILARKKGEE